MHTKLLPLISWHEIMILITLRRKECSRGENIYIFHFAPQITLEIYTDVIRTNDLEHITRVV